MPQKIQNQQFAKQPRSLTAHNSETSLDRHRRKCSICHHPEREAIEEEFLHWHNPVNIACAFKLGDRRVLYRHAHATGLYEQRRRNYLFTIENVLEYGDDIEFTAAAYIKAVRAYACLCDTVRWSEPVTRVTHEYNVHTEASAPRPAAEKASTHQPEEDSVSASGALCGSGLQPRHNGRSRESHLLRASSAQGSRPNDRDAAKCSSPAAPSAEEQATASSTSLPQAALNPPAAPSQPPPADSSANVARKSKTARATSSTSPEEEFIATALSVLPASSLKRLGLRTSNRHIPELETRVSHRKQRSEVASNRHKITK